MLPAIEIGKPLPEMGSYRADVVARSFWRLSYRCGRGYLSGMDANGQAVLVQHEREKSESYARRKRLTKPRNHCGPIIRRYNDFVFRRPAKLPEPIGPIYEMMEEDADAAGTSLRALMRRALQRAQIERECFLLPDSTAPADGAPRSVAQAQAIGVRPVIRIVGADAVPWIEERDGVLVSALVVMEDDEGKPFARHYTAKEFTDYPLKADGATSALKWTVDGLGTTKTHPYGACPLVRLRPLFDQADDTQADDTPGEAQIAPMAESQQMIANLLAFLYEEIANVTFSQMAMTGVSAEAVKEVMIGNNRLICLPNPSGTITMIGADPAQAKTISDAIQDQTVDLYRQAGVTSNDPFEPGVNPESGVAKAFKFNDLAANLSALADATEDAHNAIMRRVCDGNGEAYPGDADYPDDFNMPDYAGEMATLISTVTASALPGVIREMAVRQFVSRNMQLTDDQEATLDAQLARADQIAETATSTIPFPSPASRTAGT